MHEMRLAQTNTAIKKQRVVGTPRILGNLVSGGLGELIALSCDERLESEVRLQACTDDQAISTSRTRRWQRRSNRQAFRGLSPRADLNSHHRDIAAVLIT